MVKMCELCGDPMPLEEVGTICNSCETEIESAVEKETEWNVESAEGESSPVRPSETTLETSPVVPTSENTPVSNAVSALDALDFGTPAPTLQNPAEPPNRVYAPEDAHVEPRRKPSKSDKSCEACGSLQSTLHSIKTPNGQMELCDTCFTAEVSLKNVKTDDPMQGKVVHPDELERDVARDEIMSMDAEDQLIYNEELIFNADSDIDLIQKRIDMLMARLIRTKLRVKASKRILLHKLDAASKAEKDAYYAGAEERLKRSRAKVAKSEPSSPRKPRKSEADRFREAMKINGLSDEWIDKQLKLRGLL